MDALAKESNIQPLPYQNHYSPPLSPPQQTNSLETTLTNSPPSQEIAKKRTRRTIKNQRGIVGASLDVIKERRAQRPEARAAARQEAMKAGKEKKATAESKKKMEKAKSAAGAARGQTRAGIASKQGAKGAQSKATGKTR